VRGSISSGAMTPAPGAGFDIPSPKMSQFVVNIQTQMDRELHTAFNSSMNIALQKMRHFI